MVVNTQSLPYKWYQYWVEKGGRQPYQENLCHFVRVLFFYAPWRWFFLARTATVVTPWTVSLAAIILAGLRFFPHITLIILGILAAATAIVGVGFGIVYLLATSDWIDKHIWKPLENMMRAIGRTFKSAWEAFSYKVVWRLPVWSFFVLMAVLTGLCFFPMITLIICGIVVAVGLFIGLIFVTFLIISTIVDRLEARSSRLKKEERKPSGAADFFKVIREYLKAAHRAVCPFVEFRKPSEA